MGGVRKTRGASDGLLLGYPSTCPLNELCVGSVATTEHLLTVMAGAVVQLCSPRSGLDARVSSHKDSPKATAQRIVWGLSRRRQWGHCETSASSCSLCPHLAVSSF